MWIQNISLREVIAGEHYDPGIRSMLIQIVDPDMEFPKPKYSFKEVYQFRFLDLEKSDDCINDKWKISDEQAEDLVLLLQQAYNERCNVVVHCHAGVCRSGAVVEVGVIMGFDDLEGFRSPNLLVKHKMMKVLGLAYDSEEKHTINGVETEWGFIVPSTKEK